MFPLQILPASAITVPRILTTELIPPTSASVDPSEGFTTGGSPAGYSGGTLAITS